MRTKDPSGRPSTTPGTDPSTLRERFIDALGVLDEGGMRWRVIGVTIAFPAVMLLGGALTSLSSSIFLRLLAAVPALLLIGMVGGFGQFVLSVTLQGLAHADNPPRPIELVRQAPRMLQRLGALVGTFLGPGLLVVLLGHWPVGILMMLVGLALMPVSAALLLGTGSWRALDPRMVVTALRRAGRATMTDAAVTAALCVPALLALLLTLSQSTYTTIAVVGPLAATPALLGARLLGLSLCEHRHALAGLFALPAVEELATAPKLPKSAPRARSKPAAPARRPRPATKLSIARHTPLKKPPAQSPAAAPAPAATATPTAAAKRRQPAPRQASSSAPRSGK